MENKAQIKKAIYAALVMSGHAMGKDLKSVSWFGRHHSNQVPMTDEKIADLEVA